VTDRFIGEIPPVLWSAAVPGVPTRTIRVIAAHLHNSRCSWIKTLGRSHGIVAPKRVDHRAVTARQLKCRLSVSVPAGLWDWRTSPGTDLNTSTLAPP